MGNGLYCKKIKLTSKSDSSDSKDIKPGIPKNTSKFSTKDLIEKIKSEIQSDLNSSTSLGFLTGLELNRILHSETNGFDISMIVKMAEIKEKEVIMDMANKIYVMIGGLVKKLNENNEKHKILMDLSESMKTILDDLVVKLNSLNLERLQYKNIPFKYLEVMIELYQIILSYQSGMLVDESKVWWDRARYGESFQFYNSRFIDIAGKIRFEMDYLESAKIRKNVHSRHTFCTSAGYGIRTISKKNTAEIRDVSAQIFKEKEDLKNLILGYLEELTTQSCQKFTELMKILKEKTENITENEENECSIQQPHRISANIFHNKKNKKIKR